MAQQNFAEQKALFDEAKQTIFVCPTPLAKINLVEMSAGFLVLAPGGTTQANFLELVLEEALSPEDSTASFHAEV